MLSERGQGTIDYVALIAALVILLGAAAALAGGGAPGVADAIVGQVRRALCIVTGGACPAEGLQPCVVASERDDSHAAVTILLVRIDGDRYIVREKLSDGTVRLTLAHRGGAGVEVGIGGRASIKLKGRKLGFDNEARGALEGVLGYGEVFIARDDREADKILSSLRYRLPLIGGGPEPRERFVDGGSRELSRLGIGGPAAAASLEGITEIIGSARRDLRSGAVTIGLNAGSAAWALLSAFMAGPSGASDRHVQVTVTLDRDYRPVELALSASGLLAGGGTLPIGLVAPPGIGEAGSARLDVDGRRWELGARLDLRDPQVAAAWDAFRHDPTSSDAIRVLARQVRDRAQLDVRTYAVSSESDGAAAGLAAGLRVGGELDHTVDRARLLAASTRPPGGVWAQRSDCVAA